MIEKIQDFLRHEHTPLEKGLLISVALLSGIIIGFILAPIKKGVKMWSDNGNGNGCNNTDNTLPKPKKGKKQNAADFKMFTLDEAKASN